MKLKYWKHKVKMKGRNYTFTVKEWNCCGHQWQLLLSKRYPDRYKWNPTCPDCKSTI